MISYSIPGATHLAVCNQTRSGGSSRSDGPSWYTWTVWSAAWDHETLLRSVSNWGAILQATRSVKDDDVRLRFSRPCRLLGKAVLDCGHCARRDVKHLLFFLLILLQCTMLCASASVRACVRVHEYESVCVYTHHTRERVRACACILTIHCQHHPLQYSLYSSVYCSLHYAVHYSLW